MYPGLGSYGRDPGGLGRMEVVEGLGEGVVCFDERVGAGYPVRTSERAKVDIEVGKVQLWCQPRAGDGKGAAKLPG